MFGSIFNKSARTFNVRLPISNANKQFKSLKIQVAWTWRWNKLQKRSIESKNEKRIKKNTINVSRRWEELEKVRNTNTKESLKEMMMYSII